jgi:hypothetical protein
MTAKPVPEHISDERLAEIIKGCEGVTPGPWQVVVTTHPWSLEEREILGETIPAKTGEHTELRVFTTWEDGQLKSPYPVVNSSVGIGLATGKPVHMVAMEEPVAAHIARLDPQTVYSILTELQHRREAEAGTPVAFRWLDGEGHNAGWRYSDVDPRQDDREVEMSGAHSVGVCEPLYLAASPSSPASGVRVSDGEIEAIHQVYLAKVREYDADFRRDDKPDDFWEKKYGTRLHSTGLGERWALRCALETVARAKSALGEHS